MWLAYLFSSISIGAESFFAPTLRVLSSALSLSESIAGVTLLALGNGAADLFSTFSAFNSDFPGIAVAELIGLFVSFSCRGQSSMHVTKTKNDRTIASPFEYAEPRALTRLCCSFTRPSTRCWIVSGDICHWRFVYCVSIFRSEGSRCTRCCLFYGLFDFGPVGVTRWHVVFVGSALVVSALWRLRCGRIQVERSVVSRESWKWNRLFVILLVNSLFIGTDGDGFISS